MALELSHEGVWMDKWRYDEAESLFYSQSPVTVTTSSSTVSSLASQIAKVREDIQNTRAATCTNGPAAAISVAAAPAGSSSDVLSRVEKVEAENRTLRSELLSMSTLLKETIARLSKLECSCQATAAADASPQVSGSVQEVNDEDEVDLFGSDDDDEEDAEAARVREERLKAYAEKKSKKAGPIAKSSVLLDCKPWDDETDLKIMEEEIRKIEMDGLVWGAAKQMPLAFGINKLSILCTVEDEKVSVDDLSEKIQELENYVQSVDIAAFNKI